MGLNLVRKTLNLSPVWMALFSGLAGARLLSTSDSGLYSQSAESLFGSQFVGNYHWLREPLYPLFLRGIHFVWASDILLSLVQSGILGLALLLLVRELKLGTVMTFVVSLIIFGSSVIVGLNGAILQQSLFASLLLIIGAFFIRSLRELSVSGSLSLRTLLLLMVAQSAALLTSFLLLPTVGVVSLTLFLVFLTKRREKSTAKILRLILALSIPPALLAGWWVFKFSQIGFDRVPNNLASWPFHVDTMNFGNSPWSDRLLSLFAIAPDANQEVIRESYLFSINDVASKCGSLYTDEPHYFLPTCRSTLVESLYAQTSQFSHFAFIAITLLGLLLGVVLLTLNKFGASRFLALIPLSFLATYATLGMAISRYSTPAFPILAVILAHAVAQIFIPLVIDKFPRAFRQGSTPEIGL